MKQFFHKFGFSRQFGDAKRSRLSLNALSFSKLEQRKLLASISGNNADQVTDLQTFEQTWCLDVSPLRNSQDVSISLPKGLPDSFSVPIDFDGEQFTLRLEKNSIFGPNTKFLVDNGNGKLEQIKVGADPSYLGDVIEHPQFSVSALLMSDGLHANIIRPGSRSIIVKPNNSTFFPDSHNVYLDELAATGDNYGEHNDEEDGNFGELGDQSNGVTFSKSNPDVDVLEFEIGVEIGSRAFEATSAYNGILATAQASAMSIIGNMDARYLHGATIKHRLGTVMIRTDAATDPMRNSVTGTGTSGTAGSSLAAFRDYWNNNSAEVGNTHDVAIYHVLSAPSGLAYVNSIGSSNRYATSGGNGATSWADGTAVHELGHSWNLAHVNAGQFYESKPRDNAGSNVSGGAEVFVSVMHGSGTHNIGRLATSEAERVISAKNNKSQFGDELTTTVAIKPFGKHDTAFADTDPVFLDVLANDYDSNNDVLELQLLDTVSQMGGVITFSAGTGPDGRDELVYTPPAGGTGDDFFSYKVVDSTGRSDFGTVNISGPAVVDLTQSNYLYDLGTEDSPVFASYDVVSDKTIGELGFTTDGPNPVESRDRGSISGVNEINRDHIRLRSTSAFHHRLAPGVYDVLLTIGDATENSSPIQFTAEDSVSLTTNSHVPATFTNYVLSNVSVTDGELNIDIENLGFSSNITRLNISKVSEIATVDPSVKSYFYDLGANDSVLFTQSTDTYTRLAHNVSGDISFTGGNPASFDRGTATGVNDINRDGIVANGNLTLNHQVPNGVWNVLVNIGDRDFVRDDINISAEGTTFAVDIDRGLAEFNPNIIFDVEVTDGELNLQLDDQGGVNSDISITRLILRQVSEIVEIDPSVSKYFYDLGALDSVLFGGNSDPYVRLSHNVGGDVNFSGGNPASFDRGTTSGVNDINRDGVVATGSTTLNHLLPNGTWQILVNIGDRDFTRDNITVTAEDQVFAADVDRAPAAFGPNIIFNVQVTDGELNLKFDDLGGVNDDISLTRIIMTQLPEVASVEVNAGETQRSVVDELVVTFAGLVDLDAGAFSVLQRSDLTGATGISVDSSFTTEVIGGNTVATIVFDSLTRGTTGALIDGNYQLTIDHTKVTRDGTTLVMVEDYVFGDAEQDEFFSLYGSSNGSRTINVFNLLDFRKTYLKSAGDSDFDANLDFDGNDTVNVFDLLAFRQRYQETLQFS